MDCICVMWDVVHFDKSWLKDVACWDMSQKSRAWDTFYPDIGWSKDKAPKNIDKKSSDEFYQREQEVRIAQLKTRMRQRFLFAATITVLALFALFMGILAM